MDEGKILIYGDIEPLETLLTKLNALHDLLSGMEQTAFANRQTRKMLLKRVALMQSLLKRGHQRPVAAQLQGLAKKVDGCIENGRPDRTDWLRSCSEQTSVYWALHELKVLLAIKSPPSCPQALTKG